MGHTNLDNSNYQSNDGIACDASDMILGSFYLHKN